MDYRNDVRRICLYWKNGIAINLHLIINVNGLEFNITLDDNAEHYVHGIQTSGYTYNFRWLADAQTDFPFVVGEESLFVPCECNFSYI